MKSENDKTSISFGKNEFIENTVIAIAKQQVIPKAKTFRTYTDFETQWITLPAKTKKKHTT